MKRHDVACGIQGSGSKIPPEKLPWRMMRMRVLWGGGSAFLSDPFPQRMMRMRILWGSGVVLRLFSAPAAAEYVLGTNPPCGKELSLHIL